MHTGAIRVVSVAALTCLSRNTFTLGTKLIGYGPISKHLKRFHQPNCIFHIHKYCVIPYNIL